MPQELAQRPRVLVGNKVDMPGTAEASDRVSALASERGIPYFPVSAVTGEGMDPLVLALGQMVLEMRESALDAPEPEHEATYILRPGNRDKEFEVVRTGTHAYEVRGRGVERMVIMTELDNEEARSIPAAPTREDGRRGRADRGRCAGWGRGHHRGSDVRVRGRGSDVEDASRGRGRDVSDLKRIVIKVGSSTLVAEDGTLDRAYIDDLVDQIARVRAQGVSAVLVTSGAIAAGRERLGDLTRPRRHPVAAGSCLRRSGADSRDVRRAVRLPRDSCGPGAAHQT